MPAKSITPSPVEAHVMKEGRGLLRFDRAVRGAALWGGGAMLIGLMGLTVLDVILRYVFNAPLFGARDLAKLMLLVMVVLSVAYSARTGGQVAIEVFSGMLGPRLTRWSDAGIRLTALLMLLVLTACLWGSGREAGRFGEASLVLGIPFAPFYFIFAFGMLLYALVLMVEIALILRGRTDKLLAAAE